MNSRELRLGDLEYWAAVNPKPTVFAGDPDDDRVVPVTCLVTDNPGVEGYMMVRVPWQPDEEDLKLLNSGGTIWLSNWGGLSPHYLEVSPYTPPTDEYPDS